MNLKTIAFTTGEPGDCYYHEWPVQASQKPSAWVHIMHGMAEHSARYADLATYLNQQGFHVTADDHGWNQMVDDQLQLIEHLSRDNQLPLIILGHSMGSFLAMHTCQRYAARLADRLQGLVLSGSNYAPPWFCNTASLIARVERARLGGGSVSKLLETMSFGAFNNAFKPVRTEKDWISSDPETVDRYIADPHCGGAISTQSWYDFLRGLADLSAPAAMARINSNLPIYVFSGALDPVGGAGKGVKKLVQMLESAGVKQVSCRLYEGGHHEMLNETSRVEVYADLLTWLDSLNKKV
jgi:alpha-beta hydrolase superfamily lysophospholipase